MNTNKNKKKLLTSFVILFCYSFFLPSAFANDLQLQKRSNTNTTEMNGLNLKRRVTKINHVV